MKINLVHIEWNPTNGHRWWVVEGENGTKTYEKNIFPHECMVRRMYSEGKTHLWEISECNGCSGACYCRKGYAEDEVR